jgi:hypothetical protein
VSEISNVGVTIDVIGKNNVRENFARPYHAVKFLSNFSDKFKVIHLVITYKNGDVKRSNLTQLQSATTWLNLNDTDNLKKGI